MFHTQVYLPTGKKLQLRGPLSQTTRGRIQMGFKFCVGDKLYRVDGYKFVGDGQIAFTPRYTVVGLVGAKKSDGVKLALRAIRKVRKGRQRDRVFLIDAKTGETLSVLVASRLAQHLEGFPRVGSLIDWGSPRGNYKERRLRIADVLIDCVAGNRTIAFRNVLLLIDDETRELEPESEAEPESERLPDLALDPGTGAQGPGPEQDSKTTGGYASK